MKYCIVISEQDIAGLNIRDKLTSLCHFRQKEDLLEYRNIMLTSTARDSIVCDNIDTAIDADVFVFATRHESKKGLPSLCVHAPGNWGRAEYGGRDNQLCIAPASLMRSAFLIMERRSRGLPYVAMPEATHHGPYLSKPCMFIEIGSREQEWKDPKAGRIIAETILEMAERGIKKTETAIGIGGLHHAPRFSRLMLNNKIAFGHICPKYNLASLSETMLRQAIERTEEKVDMVYLDFKGLGSEKQRIISMLEKLGIEYKKVK